MGYRTGVPNVQEPVRDAADLSQTRRDHSRPRLVQLPSPRAEKGAGGPHRQYGQASRRRRSRSQRFLARYSRRPRLADRDRGRTGRQAFSPALGAAPRRQSRPARRRRRPAAHRAPARRRLIPLHQPKCSAKALFQRRFAHPINALAIRGVEDQSGGKSMTEAKSLTPKKELAQRSPTDDEATYVLNDDVRSGTGLSEGDGRTDEYNLDLGKNGGFIAVIESSVFLRECIRRSLQSAFPLPVITYSSVSELQRQPRPVGPTLVALSLLEVGKEASFCTLKTLPESFPGIPVIVLAYKNDPELVARFSQIDGYRCLSLMRASGVVKCQLALA